MKKSSLLILSLLAACTVFFSSDLSAHIVPERPASTALPTVEDLRVTILGDMTVSRWTHGEWGFSALVEIKTNGTWKKILFDTGAEPATVASNTERLANLAKMKDANGKPISLCDADTAVLSHNHQDHVMGLVEIRRRCGNGTSLATTYVGGPEIFWSRPYHGTSPIGRNDDNVMLAGNGINQALGIDAEYEAGVKQLYESSGGHFVMPPKQGPMALEGFPGVWITGAIPRLFDEKTYPAKPALVDPSRGEAIPDTVPEDQALVVNTSQGLVVITGCAHSGVVNTVTYAQSMLGQTMPIYALLGGYHLFQEQKGDGSVPGTLAWTAAKLRNTAPGLKFLLGAHCTGLEAFAYLRDALKLDNRHAVYSTVATMFRLDQGIVPPNPGLNNAPGT